MHLNQGKSQIVNIKILVEVSQEHSQQQYWMKKGGMELISTILRTQDSPYDKWKKFQWSWQHKTN